jgi:ATP-binding cassette subfamily B protein
MKRNLLGEQTKDSLRWLCGAIDGEKKGLLLLFFLNLLQGLIFPGVAFLMKMMIDGALGGKRGQLILYSVMLMALILVQVVLNAAANWIGVRSSTGIKKRIRLQTFDSVLKSEYLSMSKYHSGEIINRILWDTNQICETLVYTLPGTVLKGTQLLMMVLFLFLLDHWLALAGVLYGVMAMAILYFSRRKFRRFYGETRKEEGKLFGYFQEAIANILLIKGAGLYDTMTEKAVASEGILDEKIKIQSRYAITVRLFIELLLRIGFVFLVIWCAFAVVNGRIGPGSLTALALMSVQVQSQFLGVSQSVTYLISMLTSADRLRELTGLDKEPDSVLQEAMTNSAAIYDAMDDIVLKDICYAYDDRPVLDKASLRIQKGEFVAVSGVSGIGKSTFLRLLLGVISPASGKVSFGEVEASAATRTLFAYVPQDSALLSGTIRENVTLFCKDAEEKEILAALHCSCAHEFLAALPDGIDTVIGEQGKGLSAGQVQRLAIARALLSQAPILMLDEVTSALDGETESRVLRNLKALKGKTIVAITHREAALMLASSRYTLVDGQFFKG